MMAYSSDRISEGPSRPLIRTGNGSQEANANRFIHIEIIYQGDHCPSCQYMAEAVEEVLPAYGERIRFTKVEYMKHKMHARRFYELSASLYGEEELRKRLKCAPIPSLFIDGEMIFDVIPPRDELIDAIESALKKDSLVSA